MQRTSLSFITILIFFLTACSSVDYQNWMNFIHDETAFVIVAEDGMKINDIADKEYFTYLDDLSPAPIQQLSSLNIDFPAEMNLIALALYPATSTQSHFLWIGEYSDADIDDWAPRFYEPFSQNNYDFKGHKIHRLLINKSEMYAAQAGKWLLISKGSIVVENALRTALGEITAMDYDRKPTAGSLVLNTPALDNWLEQFTTIENRPSLLNSFAGTRPVELSFSTSEDTLNNIQISGSLNLNSGTHSVLTDAFSFENKPIRLDRHIGSNAAAFAILRLPPSTVPAEPEEDQQSRLDSLLLGDMDLYQQMSSTLDTEFAFVAFPESGLLTSGEYLFLRMVKNKNAFVRHLEQLAADDMITKIQSTYHINSLVMAELIGSELATFRDFYLSFSGDVAVIAKRRGLAESVNADRTRRRVIYYDETYSSVRDEQPNSLSGFAWISSSEFLEFLKPFMKPDNIAGSLIGRFDITSITMTKEAEHVNLAINTYTREGSFQPYEELWVLPLSNVNLSAQPILGDLVGSSTREIVFSTIEGNVYAIAADGTIAMEASTEGIQPVGGPVLYDWYGNGQLVVLLPAGNKIFAWNSNGDLLPKFPLELDANITAPILIDDILRNGVPEIVVATDNRQIHVLDGRGENVRGWPQNTNAVVTSKPVFELLENSWSLWVFSENALHSWMRNGVPRPEFPQFINAQFTGSPVIYNDQIIGSAADGYLYSIGKNPFFADSSATADTLNEVKVNMQYVAGSELTAVKVEENVLLRGENGFYRENLFATQSVNGSVFLYNSSGELRFTQSLGQPASSTFIPQLADIDGDRNMDLLALAEFGRFYAWEVLTNQRIYGIPTSGMRYPLIVDLNGDGQLELIAQTREGLRTWTINKVQE